MSLILYIVIIVFNPIYHYLLDVMHFLSIHLFFFILLYFVYEICI